MEMVQPQVVNFSDDHYHELLSDFKTINTYDGVRSWDERASVEIGRLVDLTQGLSQEVSRLTAELDEARKIHSSKSFISRLTSDRKAEREIQSTLAKYQDYLQKLSTMTDALQESIDFSPNSPEDQKADLKELRLRKKELQLEKKEIMHGMKEIRTEARLKSAAAGQASFLWSQKTAAYERRHIRYEREKALQPQETARAAVERQLLEVERRILWLEQFRS